jgi:hypothetical protein
MMAAFQRGILILLLYSGNWYDRGRFIIPTWLTDLKSQRVGDTPMLNSVLPV